MKVRLNKTAWRFASGFIGSFILAVSFQNCGKAGFDSQLSSSVDPSTADASLVAKYGSTTAAKVQSIPFAFDASLDTITYNSCAESQLNNNATFFTLKAGAYATGGIKLNTQFFDYADQNFSPVYPDTALTVNQYKDFLADSPANNGAVPAMAIRVKNSLADVYVQSANGSGSVTLNRDVLPLVSNLTDTLIMDSIISKGLTTNYFPFSPDQKILEGTINYNSDESTADGFRNILMSSGILALTYMVNNSEVNTVRSPATATPVKIAYGKGYNLTFSPPAVAGGAINNPNHVLAQVYETDLSTPNVGGRTWSCNHVYPIVRAQDAATYCPAQSYVEIKSNSAYRAELALLRRHLRADQWDINVARGCVVPKGPVSCYKEESINGAPVVQYDLTQQCFRPNGNYAGTIPNSACLHFITVCTRN
ncbi:MAG: hypothetical protein ACXVCY_00945 [Pseudobdellovibrionaceae bacterium]